MLEELVHDCLVNKVPFPALETFEDRKAFPKRYFLFFDLFVRAGRHNRVLWKKAIRDNKGQNNMRFGPAIFEAHVRTTVRENYFKWIFQQLSDIHEVEDKDVDEFQMEYDENVYTDLPRTLVCTHKELTKFPFKNYEIDYGEDSNRLKRIGTEEVQTEEDDNDSYCSANSVDPTDQSVKTNANTASENGDEGSTEKKFLLVYKNANNNRFCEVREKQWREIKSIIEKTRDQYKDILESLKGTIKKIREVKKNLPETDPMYKAAIAKARR